MNRRALLLKIARGEVQNVSFKDLQSLAEGLGFHLARTRGSHHVYMHSTTGAMLNLQEHRGQAKPYQVRQLQRLVERYDLRLEEAP